VGTISSNHGKVDIFVERVDRGKSGFLWLFSSETLDAIPDLYEEVNEVSVDTILPEFLVSHRIAGIVLFEWLAVLVGMPLLYFLIVLLNRILSRLVGRWRRRLYKRPDLPDSKIIPNPVGLLLLAFLIYWITSKLRLSLLERQFWISTAIIITIAASTWLMILLNSRGETYILKSTMKPNAWSMPSRPTSKRNFWLAWDEAAPARTATSANLKARPAAAAAAWFCWPTPRRARPMP
jgi:MscS family membrane protein